MAVASKGRAPVAAWVQADRLPGDHATHARRVCRKRHGKQGRQPKKSTWFLAGWVLVLTSLQPALLPGRPARAGYRVRWPIEMAMKRWKRLRDADLRRARDGSPLADVWLHGTWLYALRLDKRLRRTMGSAWSRLDGDRLATWWRPWKVLPDAVAPHMTGVLAWPPTSWVPCLPVLFERPRRRQLQRLPIDATTILHRSTPPLGLSRLQESAA